MDTLEQTPCITLTDLCGERPTCFTYEEIWRSYILSSGTAMVDYTNDPIKRGNSSVIQYRAHTPKKEGENLLVETEIVMDPIELEDLSMRPLVAAIEKVIDWMQNEPLGNDLGELALISDVYHANESGVAFDQRLAENLPPNDIKSFRILARVIGKSFSLNDMRWFVLSAGGVPFTIIRNTRDLPSDSKSMLTNATWFKECLFRRRYGSNGHRGFLERSLNWVKWSNWRVSGELVSKHYLQKE